jgi:hypothetical protein
VTKLENCYANCGGRFGLVCHHPWGLRRCRKACKDGFLRKRRRTMRTCGSALASSLEDQSSERPVRALGNGSRSVVMPAP